jgi:hypothetical protein
MGAPVVVARVAAVWRGVDGVLKGVQRGPYLGEDAGEGDHVCTDL